MHLLPGLLLFIVFLLLAPRAFQFDIPPLAPVLAAMLLLVVPLELGYLWWQAQKGKKPIISYRESVPFLQFVLLVIGLLAWSLILALLISRFVEGGWRTDFLAWAPPWWNLTALPEISRSSLWLLVGSRLLILGIIGPVVEEFYFRGYLLPRLAQFGRWGPILHAALFSLGHFIEPYGFLSRFVAVLPVAYVVQKKRSVYPAIAWHVLLNILSALSLLPLSGQ